MQSLDTNFNNLICKLYDPEQKLSLDEAVCGFKGRSKHKTYNPNKPDKYGIKSYMLCESNSGLVLRLEHALSNQKIIDIVKRFTNNLKSKNHIIYMDNFYTSINLTKDLATDKIHSVGTCRKNRGTS